MASSITHEKDLELFDCLYKLLSDFTYPSFSDLQLVLDHDGYFNHLSCEFRSEVIFFSICLSSIILQELCNLSCIHADTQKDIETIIKRIANKSIILLDLIIDSGMMPIHFSLLRYRMKELT